MKYANIVEPHIGINPSWYSIIVRIFYGRVYGLEIFLKLYNLIIIE
jgi:hypothetical protein